MTSTRLIGTDPKITADSLTNGNENFWIPFAAEALKEQILRNASNLDFKAILPKTKEDYKKFLRGLEYTTFKGSRKTVLPSPAYMDARATIERGLVAALPNDAYNYIKEKRSTENKTKFKAINLFNYLHVELQFAVEKGQRFDDYPRRRCFPTNVENFKTSFFV